MDEAARTSGPAVDEPKRGPQQIREDIEQTREELGETVEALAAKTDVKAHAKARVDETKQRALDTVETVKERVVGTKPADLKEAARAKGDAARLLRNHPELFGLVAAFAAGLLVRSLAGS